VKKTLYNKETEMTPVDRTIIPGEIDGLSYRFEVAREMTLAQADRAIAQLDAYIKARIRAAQDAPKIEEIPQEEIIVE
jgi:hypothetical protein